MAAKSKMGSIETLGVYQCDSDINNKGGAAEDKMEANCIRIPTMHTFPSAHVKQMEFQALRAWFQMAALPLTQKKIQPVKCHLQWNMAA